MNLSYARIDADASLLVLVHSFNYVVLLSPKIQPASSIEPAYSGQIQQKRNGKNMCRFFSNYSENE